MSNRKKYPSRAAWEGAGPLTKFAVPQRKIDEESRRITFVISTAARDRDGDIIEPTGWELANYLKNPVVLWSHDPSRPEHIMGRAENTSVQDGKLVSVAHFATRETNPLADTVFRLYKDGFLNAVSVGFEPVEMDLMEGDEAGRMGFRFIRQKLLEYSCVAIPSNPEALVVARSAGIDVAPCERWIERALDEHASGATEGLLNRAYIALKGKLHPAMQDAIARANVAALRRKDNAMATDTVKMDGEDEDEDERPMLSTSEEDGHAHEYREGATQTEPGGDDGHVHSLTYAEDGSMTVEATLGHSHTAGGTMPKNGDVDSEEEVAVQTVTNNPFDPNEGQPEGQRSAAAPVEKAITDWPQPGMSLPVSLLTSEYRPFPAAEAKALREDWPEIWALGNGPDDAPADEEAIRAREAWAAKHVDGYELADVVSQVKHLVRGSRGIEHMRKMLSLAKELVIDKRDEAKGLSPEEISAVEDIVVEKAVIPAIAAAFRKVSGRVS